MTATIEVVWLGTLIVDGMPVDLKVFGPYVDGEYDVEVYVFGDYVGTKTLPNNDNVIEDTKAFVYKCLTQHEAVVFDNAPTLTEY